MDISYMDVGVDVAPFDDSRSAFTAHLFINGYPLVLNQQYMQARLLNKRLTTEERLGLEAGLVDRDIPRYVTVASFDDDVPLSFQFVSMGNRKYELYAKLPGKYNGWRLSIDSDARHLVVSDGPVSSTFSLMVDGRGRADRSEFLPGPSQVVLVSDERNSGMYLARRNYRNKHGSTSKNSYSDIIVDVNPNVTGHHAFNGRVAEFVLRIVEYK